MASSWELKEARSTPFFLIWSGSEPTGLVRYVLSITQNVKALDCIVRTFGGVGADLLAGME